MFLINFMPDQILNMVLDWVYQQIVNGLAQFFGTMNESGYNLFAQPWVMAIVQLFSKIGWALFVTGIVVAVFEFAIEAQNGRANPRGLALNIIKGFFAVNLFTVVPVQLFALSVDLQKTIANDISGIVVVSQYSMQIMQSFIMLAFVLVLLPQTMASMSRINEVLKCEDTVKECDHNKFNEELFQKREKGSIEFKDVSFCYPDSNTPVIEHISFKTKPGTTTAIIGSTGSGKSTIINLIPRFYDATSGEIILDNYNIKDIPQKTLRDCIGFVPQQALLFSGTIEENIRFGNKNASDEEILEALSVAQTEHFISKLPNGTKTFVSQGGKNFSGGQKQRLCIARALVKKPEIYVFDDSFSALDFKTDAKLRQALKKYIVNSSIIIVAQRVSSILDADNIIVLNEGKCVGQGTHAELLKSCPIYQDIVKSQLDPDEVEKTINILNSIKSEGGN